jgi:hypothetical protein
LCGGLSEEKGVGAGDNEAVTAVDVEVDGSGRDTEDAKGHVGILADGRYTIDGSFYFGMFDLTHETDAGV